MKQIKIPYLAIGTILGAISIVMFIYGWIFFGFLAGVVSFGSFVNCYDMEKINAENTSAPVKKSRRRYYFDITTAKERETTRKIIRN